MVLRFDETQKLMTTGHGAVGLKLVLDQRGHRERILDTVEEKGHRERTLETVCR